MNDNIVRPEFGKATTEPPAEPAPVVSLAAQLNDNTLTTPAQMFREAAAEIEAGERVCNKAIAVTLQADEENFRVGFYASNIKTSEMLAALDCLRSLLLREMGYT